MPPLGGLFPFKGLNSALSAPTSEQVCKKKGGGGGGGGKSVWTVSLLTDYSPKGFLTSRSRRELLVHFMISSKSLVTYPPTKVRCRMLILGRDTG